MEEKEALLKRNRELGAILEVSRVLTSSFDLEENLTSVMSTLAGQLEMQRGCVFLLEDSGELRIVAAHGLTRDEILRGKYKAGEGIVGMVMETGSPMFIPDIGQEPKFLNRTGSRPRKDGVSFISVPIRHKARVIGALGVDRIYAEGHGDVDDDLRVLRIVASLIAQFVMLWEAYRRADLEREDLRIQLKDRYSLPNIVGESEKFRAVLKTVLKVADTDASVLLLGESGTGKELIARTLHFEGRRAKKPFVAVNCAALPENLLEVELFGCEKGAFTGATARRTGRFELARGGSIFLDEIGELPLQLQAKLLRVLQERTFERVGSSTPIQSDVRVITATNRNLHEEVTRGRFREDLYWRLNVVPIVLPPLRERKSDIPLLAAYYTERFNEAYGRKVAFSEAALKELSDYSWPGNVRELANTLERLIIMSEKSVIDADDLPYGMRHATVKPSAEKRFAKESLTTEVLSLEKERISRALRENGFVQQRAAEALGITPRQLGYRIRKYGIDLGGRGA
ncbi:MAG: sigma-54-dependent Fis family transcriptional regulator [Thermodesulfovibrionales bacterium]